MRKILLAVCLTWTSAAFATPTVSDIDILLQKIAAAKTFSFAKLRELFGKNPRFEASCYLTQFDFTNLVVKGKNGDPWADARGGEKLPESANVQAQRNFQIDVQTEMAKQGAAGFNLSLNITPGPGEEDLGYLKAEKQDLKCDFDERRNCGYIFAPLSAGEFQASDLLPQGSVTAKKVEKFKSQGTSAFFLSETEGSDLTLAIGVVLVGKGHAETAGFGPFKHGAENNPLRYGLHYVCRLKPLP